jgi:TolB-like protein/DNA-binding winged helix-turn-helix (wHTH) protein/Tfp pilus assembly protein PilF
MSHIVRFVDYQADLKTGELRKNGMKIRLSGQPFQILALLLERPGELITREELRAKLWPGEVFVDFDHSLNASVNKLREALCDSTNDAHFIETLPKRGYRFIAPVERQTAEPQNSNAHAPDAPAPPETPAPRGWSSRWISAAVLFAGAAIVLLFGWSAAHRAIRTSSADTQSRLLIAVMPLENLSADSGQDFFVSGLTEEVITQLGQLNPEKIGVVRYRSPSAAGQSGTLLPELRQRAGLQYLLEGSVRRQAEQTRISVRLVRVADETTMWTESFDRNVGDVLALQSEIAQRIGRELQIRMLGGARRQPADPAVVEAYFKGRFELATHRLPVSDTARAYFEKAITLDPSYAPAYAGLADYYSSRAVGRDEGSEEAWRLAEKNANQAVSLDDESAETHAAIAEIKLMHHWDWKVAREHALRALQLNPSSPEAHAIYARWLRTAGHEEEALEQRKQALALDPFRGDLKEQLALEKYFARDFQEIVAEARKALVSDPNDPAAHDDLCFNLARMGVYEEAAAECGKAIAQEGRADWAAGYAAEYRKHGYAAASLWIAKRRLNELRKQKQPDLWDLANAYLAAGMKDEALHTLSEGVKTHEPGLLQIRVDPDFDSIRLDPRYTELVRQIGFPTE